MAQRKKPRRGRDLPKIANPWLPRVIQIPPRSSLKIIEDRRLYHPARRVLPVRTRRRVARLEAARQTPLYRPAAHHVQFAHPKQVIICVRRNRRKEIMHALKKTGRGGQKKPKRNFWSEVKC